MNDHRNAYAAHQHMQAASEQRDDWRRVLAARDTRRDAGRALRRQVTPKSGGARLALGLALGLCAQGVAYACKPGLLAAMTAALVALGGCGGGNCDNPHAGTADDCGGAACTICEGY